MLNVTTATIVPVGKIVVVVGIKNISNNGERKGMIKVNNVAVFNVDGAIRGMRNPLNSWHLSDSDFNEETGIYLIGEKDMQLAHSLISSGPDDAKFLRQIMISMDITAPLYWWKEMDQYKVGTTTNSTSTMHKLSSTPITRECFSFDMGNEQLVITNGFEEEMNTHELMYGEAVDDILYILEHLRLRYNQTRSQSYWRALVQLLPEAWNQTRTWTANYQVLRNIYFARKNHKLVEWRHFCDMIETLPYAKDLICYFKGE